MAVKILLVLLACAAGAAANTANSDKTLKTATAACKDQFDVIMKDSYAGDKECADLIQKAMSTAPADEAQCPEGKVSGVGSRVQKCMAKNQATTTAWTNFIKGCEIMNVNERTGAGEAEAAATAKPSCFPRFNSLTAFTDYLAGTSAKSAAGSSTAGAVLLAVAAAAACAVVLV